MLALDLFVQIDLRDLQPQENLFMKDQMTTDDQDAEGSHKDVNGFSDSGESAVSMRFARTGQDE